jgi:NAD(P)H dehydrogenase (quinone)
MTGGLAGKYASVFVSTGTLGGGQESTVLASLSTLTHHGIIYVPLGYSKTFAEMTNLTEVHGGAFFCLEVCSVLIFTSMVYPGSPWGAGTFAGADGSRQPSALELKVAKIQGQHFHSTVSKVTFK